MKRVLGLTVTFFVVSLSADAHAASFTPMLEEPVAIVCFLTGKSFAQVDSTRTELTLFQRLRQGTRVETEADSRVVLTFLTGDRYEFGGKASGTLGRAGLENRKGAIQRLSPVPTMIDIAPIAKEETPGTRLGAARIRTGGARGESIMNLYPSGGAATLAQTAALRFDPVGGYEQYQVEVEDETGNVVFSAETASIPVQISAGVLRPGSTYYFRVRTLDAEKPALRGEAVFSTLSEDHARRRAALSAHVNESRDTSLLGLLAELDRSLGLHW